MGKFELLYNILIPVFTCLGVYGMTITIRLKKTGWDLKGLLILLCLVLSVLGFIITIIVWVIRYRRLKKEELKEKTSSDIPSSGLFHHRLFLVMQEVTWLMVSFIIGKWITAFLMSITFAHLDKGIMRYQSDKLVDEVIREDSIIEARRDSIILRRKDSVTHKYLDSIIQLKIDSLNGLHKDSIKMLRRNLMN